MPRLLRTSSRSSTSVGAAVLALAAALAGTAGALAGGRPLQPAQVDVSSLPGPQTNATIAVDPSDPNVLLAGSNSFLEGTQRIYGSTDGGSTWQTTITVRPPADNQTACPS